MGFNLDTQATRSALMSVATTLAANIDATQDYIPVASTANFSTSVVAEIETTNEVVSFDSITTNLAKYAEDFTNGYWVKSGLTVSANTTVAPDGATTADSLIESSATSLHLIYSQNAGVDGTQYVSSLYGKYNGNTRNLQLAFGGGDIDGGNSFANFDLENGVIGNSGNSSPVMTSVGNGWYRCSITGEAAATGSGFTLVNSIIDDITDGFTPSYVGDGSSLIFIWGAQLEVGSVVTGFIPTTSAAVSGLTTVTRGANGTTAASATSGDDIQQLPYALLNVDMPVRLTGLSVSSDGTGAGRLTLCDKVGTHLCDVDIPDTKIFDLTFDGGILFPNGIYVANSDNITAYTLYTDKYSGDSL